MGHPLSNTCPRPCLRLGARPPGEEIKCYLPYAISWQALDTGALLLRCAGWSQHISKVNRLVSNGLSRTMCNTATHSISGTHRLIPGAHSLVPDIHHLVVSSTYMQYSTNIYFDLEKFISEFLNKVCSTSNVFIQYNQMLLTRSHASATISNGLSQAQGTCYTLW